VDGLGEFSGAPGAAAQLGQDLPCLELGVRPFAGGPEFRVGPVGLFLGLRLVLALVGQRDQALPLELIQGGGDDEPGPAVGGGRVAEPGPGPAQGLLEEPECMFDIEASNTAIVKYPPSIRPPTSRRSEYFPISPLMLPRKAEGISRWRWNTILTNASAVTATSLPGRELGEGRR
jgi:hypothetical protein